MAQAYQQLPVDEATANAKTIITHKGAFRCHRLPFGVSVAPGIFQNLAVVVFFFDNVLTATSSRLELIEELRNVLSRFRKAGLKLK